jgi:TPR repeat protein
VVQDAATCFWRAAEQGYSTAQFTLGLMHDDKDVGAVKDTATAAAWYQKAADQRYPPAKQYQLGRMYMTGKSVVQDVAMQGGFVSKSGRSRTYRCRGAHENNARWI